MFEGKRVSAILLAGGTGSRFGAKENKVYVRAAGKPILQYSLEVLTAHPYVDELVLVVHAGEEKPAGQLLKHVGTQKPCRLTAGGATRQESVYHGLMAITGEIVLIHDGARPLLRPEYISACVETMRAYPGATAAVPSKDTVKLADDAGVVTQTTKRANTWIIQTPQCFRRETLLPAHEKYRGNPSITDDCMLLELAGEKVKLVESDYTNIKVTTAEDLELAELFLRRRQGRNAALTGYEISLKMK